MSVIGCGHLGATHAAAMAEIGHDVVGVDVDPEKVAALNSKRAWFHEPGLDDLLARHVGGRLRFTTDIAAAAAYADMHFLGVGTPGGAGGGGYDLSQVFAAAEALAPHLAGPCVVVGKSTVSVGTTSAVRERMQALAPAGAAVEVAWSPEFLREGHAVADTLRPDRIVVGVLPGGQAEARIRAAFAPLAREGVPLFVTDPATVELVKGAANAFLAMKISFINAVADLCEAVGADAATVADAIGCDPRIGRAMLTPGLGYGGGCLPKDIRAFTARAQELGIGKSFGFLQCVDEVNQARRSRVVKLAHRVLGGEMTGRRVGMWGAAFKPGTDDIRDSPALDVADRLCRAGAMVRVFDPMAGANAREVHPDLDHVGTALDAVRGAHLVVLATEWPEFCEADPGEVGKVAEDRVLIDARNAVDAERWRAAGWRVHRMGQG
ncbi:UDP-glucose dehydrogenase family protein [Streptomyces sp. NPDC013953]|uniref:UDP-glucose dehydrogenase family protein n=1 Tax=Streptomyces sp. NPDC013953 TaxID=3364868 RepID=UPI0036F744AE